MKRQGAICSILLAAACQVIAQQKTNAPATSAVVAVKQPKIHWFAPAEMKPAKKIPKPVAGLDPRAWSTVVGWHPGESAFATAENGPGRLTLFWIDLGPSPVAKKVKAQR
jgi:hypothetical protein